MLHKPRNRQIVPAQLGGSSVVQGGGASLSADPVSTAKIQAHFHEDPEHEEEDDDELSDGTSESSNRSNAQPENNSDVTHNGKSKRHSSVNTGPQPLTTTTAENPSTVGNTSGTVENPPGAVVGKPPSVRELQSRDLKAVKVLGVTASVYFIAWGPYVVLVVLLSFFPHIIVPGEIRFTFMWLANSNSFMNVFIYSLMYSGFRRNAIMLFRGMYHEHLHLLTHVQRIQA